MCICVAESLCSSPETITTLSFGYIPIQNKTSFLKSERGEFLFPLWSIIKTQSRKEQQQKHVCTFLRDEPRILCLMYWRNCSRTSHLHVKITSAIMPRSARSCDGAFPTGVGRDGPLGMASS